MSLPQALFGEIQLMGVGRSLCKIVFPGSLTKEQVLNDLPSLYYYPLVEFDLLLLHSVQKLLFS